MSNRAPIGNQIQTIPFIFPLQQQSFNLLQLDNFVTSLGVDYTHYKAQPSPIGKKDIGDYRRNDGDSVDTITSNGMLYICAGKFTATTVSNTRDEKHAPTGILDPSQARLILPRFYNAGAGQDNGSRIYLAPGDRVYISDPQADVSVSTYQEMEYDPNVENVPQFPILSMDGPIIDSRNIQYSLGVDFCITSSGNIKWHAGANNPGIDPNTGKGRIYSIRYLYKAYWYITSLPHEIRITNVTEGAGRSPERMSYAAIITREFMYHNQNRGNHTNQLKSTTPDRVDAQPVESINPNKNQIFVDVTAVNDEGQGNL